MSYLFRVSLFILLIGPFVGCGVRDKIEEVKKEYDEKINQIKRGYESQLANLNSTIKQSQEKFNTLKKEHKNKLAILNEQSQRIINTLKIQNTKVMNDNADLSKNIETAKKTIQEVKQVNEDYIAKLNKNNSITEELKNNKKDLEEKIKPETYLRRIKKMYE